MDSADLFVWLEKRKQGEGGERQETIKAELLKISKSDGLWCALTWGHGYRVVTTSHMSQVRDSERCYEPDSFKSRFLHIVAPGYYHYVQPLDQFEIEIKIYRHVKSTVNAFQQARLNEVVISCKSSKLNKCFHFIMNKRNRKPDIIKATCPKEFQKMSFCEITQI